MLTWDEDRMHLLCDCTVQCVEVYAEKICLSLVCVLDYLLTLAISVSWKEIL